MQNIFNFMLELSSFLRHLLVLFSLSVIEKKDIYFLKQTAEVALESIKISWSDIICCINFFPVDPLFLDRCRGGARSSLIISTVTYWISIKPTFHQETVKIDKHLRLVQLLHPPTKENDSDRPWKVQPILNNDLHSVSGLLACSGMNAEDIFPTPGGMDKRAWRIWWMIFFRPLVSPIYDNPHPEILLTFCPSKEMSITGSSRPIFRPAPAPQAFSGNASFNVHSILMFVRSDSPAVWAGGLTEDTRRAA